MALFLTTKTNIILYLCYADSPQFSKIGHFTHLGIHLLANKNNGAGVVRQMLGAWSYLEN